MTATPNRRKARTATPSLPRVEALAYDGSTLAFGTATCVFAGPPPVGAPSPPALEGCEPTTAPRAQR